MITLWSKFFIFSVVNSVLVILNNREHIRSKQVLTGLYQGKQAPNQV